MKGMKIQPSAWNFASRRWSSLPQPGLEPPDKQHQLEQLRAEHPWLSRSVEVAQMSAWVAHGQSSGRPWSQASAALSGVTAVASAAWGLNKLIKAESGLDRVEGLGHLALATDYSLASLQQIRPDLTWTDSLANPAGYLAAGCEIFLGGADLVRGIRENDTPRKWTGLASMASGAALAGSILAPGSGGLAQAAVLISMAVRQSIYGFEQRQS